MTKVKPISTTQFYDQFFNGVPEIYCLMMTFRGYMEKVQMLTNTYVSPLLNESKNCIEATFDLSRSQARRLYPYIPRVSSLLQTLWVVSHLFTIIGTTGYSYHSLTFNKFETESGKFWYDLAMYGSITTYVLITYRHIELLISLKAQNDDDTVSEEILQDSIPLSAILKSENTHLLGVSLLVAVSEKSVFKLISAGIYSFMNLSNYLIIDMFPSYKLSSAMTPLLNYFEGILLVTAASIDYLVALIYLKESYSNGTTQYLVLYSLICLIRIESSESCKMAIKKFFNLVQYFLAKSESPNSLALVFEQLEIFCLSPEQSMGMIEDNRDTKPNLRKKKDRVTSLVLSPFTVINDLDN